MINISSLDSSELFQELTRSIYSQETTQLATRGHEKKFWEIGYDEIVT